MKKNSGFFLALLLVVATACSKSSNGGGGNSGGGGSTPTPVVPIISLAPGWKYSATLSLNFPSGMQAFSFDTIFNGRKVKAFCVAYDPSTNRFDGAS